MLFVFFIALGSLSMIQCDQLRYFVAPYKIALSVYDGGPITIIRGESTWPTFIHFTQTIDADSGIEITMVFNNATDRVYPQANDTSSINFCEMLDTAIDNPKSYEATLRVPETLGLYGQRCPIEPGKRNLNPYIFPRVVMLDSSLGEGLLTYIITVGNDDEMYLKMEVELELSYYSSASLFGVPSFATISLLAFATLIQ